MMHTPGTLAQLFHPRHLHMTEKRAALPSPPPPHGDRGHIVAHTDIVHGAAGWDARGGMGAARCAPLSLGTPTRPAPPEGQQSLLGAKAQRRHNLYPHISLVSAAGEHFVHVF